MTTVSPVNEFVPSATPDGYDHRGERTEAFAPEPVEGRVLEPAVTPSETPPPAAQVHAVASETAGYRAPGGLLRDEIRSRISKARPYSCVTVDVPEWDISVEVRSMTLGRRDELGAIMATDEADPETGRKTDLKKFYPALIIATAHDAEGNPVFTETDIEWLRSLDAHVLDKLAKPALELNGFGDEKKVDEEAGKSSGTGTSESASS